MSNTIIVPGETGEVSDGYHTFNELYRHRVALFVNVVAAHKEQAFKTWKNHKKEAWEGWFILGLNTPHGQITYHLPAMYWNGLDVRVMTYNFDYDGHKSADVVERLWKLAGMVQE